jgi:hypothetical protein
MRGEDGVGGNPSRLVDDPGAAVGDGGWAVDLVRAGAPYEAPAGRKQRVRLGLAGGAGRRAPLLLRPAIVGAVLIGCGAFASAALGPWRGWVTRTYQRLVAPVASTGEPAARPRRIAEAHRAEAAPETAPSTIDSPPPPAVAAPLLAPPPPAAPAPRSRRAAPAPSEDTAPVMEAMRALRIEGNPVRARALCARYLERHPNGTLAEEALAMTIRAAVAHHDADAGALSARYLRLYPEGAFRALARQTLAASEAVRR